jgi:hypothetical protein
MKTPEPTDLTNEPEPHLGAVEPVIGSHEWGTRDSMTDPHAGRHPSTLQLLRYFAFAHLAGPLRSTSEPFAYLADGLVVALPDSPELTAALRKLVESKDCAVRAQVDMLSGGVIKGA